MNRKTMLIGATILLLVIIVFYFINKNEKVSIEETIPSIPTTTKTIIEVPTPIPILPEYINNPYLVYCMDIQQQQEDKFSLDKYIKCLSDFNDNSISTIIKEEKEQEVIIIIATPTPEITVMPTLTPEITTVENDNDNEFYITERMGQFFHAHINSDCNSSSFEFYNSKDNIIKHYHDIPGYSSGGYIANENLMLLEEEQGHSPHGCE